MNITVGDVLTSISEGVFVGVPLLDVFVHTVSRYDDFAQTLHLQREVQMRDCYDKVCNCMRRFATAMIKYATAIVKNIKPIRKSIYLKL